MNPQRLAPVVVMVASTILTGCGSTDATPGNPRSSALAPASSLTASPDPTSTTAITTTARLDDKAFLDVLRRLDAQAGRATQALDRALGSQDVEVLKAGLTRYAAFHADVADEVDLLRPPEPTEAATRLLARGSRLLSMQTLAVVDQIAAGTSAEAALRLINDQLGSASGARQLDRALQQLQALGFEVEAQ